MELKEVFKNRRTHRAYLNKKVDRQIIDELIIAATKAPVSCNLQVTQFVVIDDEKILKDLGKKVSYKFNYSPCCIAVLHDNRFTVKRNSIVMSTGMAVENIILQATELGLGTCPMAGFSKDDLIKRILDIPSYMSIDLLLSIGHPDTSFDMMNIPKVEMASLYSFNSYSKIKSLRDDLSIDKYSIDEVIDYRRRISPTYLDRFRLNSWNDKYYHKVFNFLKTSEIISEKKVKSVLDVFSYDGQFIKILYDNNIQKNISITCSDYLQNNLDFFKREFNFNFIKINNRNIIVSEKKFDLITLIFQYKFTPNPNDLFREIYDKLNDQGRFFIAVIEEVFYKRVLKYTIKRIRSIIKKEPFNVYENSSFYKIGPYRTVTKASIKNSISYSKLKVVKDGLIYSDQKSGVKIKYYLLSK